MSAFNQSTINKSNELFAALAAVLRQFSLADLEAMQYQYVLAEAGSVVFMAKRCRHEVARLGCRQKEGAGAPDRNSQTDLQGGVKEMSQQKCKECQSRDESRFCTICQKRCCEKHDPHGSDGLTKKKRRQGWK